MAQIKKLVGEIKEFHKSVAHYEWTIPNLKSALEDISVSPRYEICNGFWEFEISKQSDSIRITVRRFPEDNNHQSVVDVKLQILSKDGNECCARQFRNLQFTGKTTSQSIDYKQLSLLNGNEDHELKVTVSHACFKCNSSSPVVLSKGFSSLEKNLKDLLASGEGSDLTIKVQNREFRVHKCIIKARSPVFFSVFKLDFMECKSTIIDITDCEPETFATFLHYLYSGKLEKISKDTVCSLYYLADKYEVLEVKKECEKFLIENLSVESFCDTVALLQRREPSASLERAHKFFRENSSAVIESAQWLSLLKDNPGIANDLIMRLNNVLQGFKRKSEELNEDMPACSGSVSGTSRCSITASIPRGQKHYINIGKFRRMNNSIANQSQKYPKATSFCISNTCPLRSLSTPLKKEG